MRRNILVLAGLITILCGSNGWAAVGNPQVRTDHPIYPGELAYSTQERLARSIIDSGDWGLGLGDSERDVALKFFLWRITHTIHDYSPTSWTPLHSYYRAKFGEHSKSHPIRPDSRAEMYAADDIDNDAMRWQFSYGYALCGTLHGVIEPQIRAIGQALGKDWRSRRVGIPGDSNHEIYFGGKWRAFDVNAMTLLFSSDDPKTAELLPFREAFGPKGGPKRPDLLDNAPKFNGKYLPKLTWSPIDKNGKLADWNWLHGIFSREEFYWDDDVEGHYNHGGGQSYFSAYSACPAVYSLRRGETFTRWFNGDEAVADLGLPGRIWWGNNLKGGPGTLRNWAHYLRDLPEYCVDTTPLIFAEDSQYNNQFSKWKSTTPTHGNGLYRWEPNLAAGDWKDGSVQVAGPVRTGKDSPALTADADASITFAFFSPYTIAAMPVDGADPALESARYGAVVRAAAVGEVPVEVSVNNGLTFQSAGALKGKDAKIDFTDQVKGRSQYLLRLTLGKGSGLDKLDLRTIVTTCRAMYPKLKADGTTITYLADGTEAFEASPDFTSKDSATRAAIFESSENVRWSGYADDLKTAWRGTKQTASVVYKVAAPSGRAIQTVSAAASIVWVAPTKQGCWADLAVADSPDGPWETVGKIDAEGDDLVGKNSNGSLWVYGGADISKQNSKAAYVRVRSCGADRPTGIRYLRLYGTCLAEGPAPLSIAYHWKSGEKTMRHIEPVPAARARHTYTIDTGPNVRNVKVAFSVPASR
jgi:hypothetical protein